MVSIAIKGLKDGCHVYVQYDCFDAFITEWKKRLLDWNLKGRKEVFFHLPEMDWDCVKALFDLCVQEELVIAGWNYLPQDRHYIVQEGNLRSGERYVFREHLILFGNVESGCEVIGASNLFILGKVSGNVDLLYKDCVLYAGSMEGNVRICDSLYQNVTSSAPLKLYYKDADLCWHHTKEENRWAKQLR